MEIPDTSSPNTSAEAPRPKSRNGSDRVNTNSFHVKLMAMGLTVDKGYIFGRCRVIVRRTWEDNIKMDLQEVGGGRGDWMELAQDWDRWRALVGTVRDFRVP